MWSRTKKRNRRLERTEVLEVKLRSEPARRARRRAVAGALLLALLGLGVAFGSTVGWSWLRGRLLDTDLFALRNIEIVTDGNWITPDQVRYWAAIEEGDNLLWVDIDRIRRDLELVPQIESASIERVLPHLLRLRITERLPVAQVLGLQPASGGDLAPVVYYLDAAGVVMPPLPATRHDSAWGEALATLPVIRGVNRAELRPGGTLTSRAVRAGLQLVQDFDRSPLSVQCTLKTIDVASPEILVVRTDDGAEVTFGLEQIGLQLERWALVREAGARASRFVATLDLSVANNCPVLWQETAPAPPPKPKAAKPSILRRKHV